jgi:phosphoribosyl 1,2-cyclic phosphate phosphodiesterase
MMKKTITKEVRFMKLTYLGTAAAEGWPALFCRCEYCKKALERGGKNLRTRSQAMVNDDLLIDFPADSFSHMQQNGLNFSAVKTLLITHSHIDHFSPTDLHLRSTSYYAHDLSTPNLTLYGNERVMKLLERERITREEEPNDTGISAVEIEAYKPFTAGKYRVTALPAFHAMNEKAFVYLIEDGEKTLLYLHDTGELFDEVYEYLAANKVRADLISYDCTYVALPSGGGHMGLDSCPKVRARLEAIGVSDEKTVSVVNHFSHNGKLIHDELEPAAKEIGFLTSYDGMVVEF